MENRGVKQLNTKNHASIFTITSIEYLTSQKQQDYLRLSLENAYDRITAFCWMDNYSGPIHFNGNDVVKVSGKKKALGFIEVIEAHSVEVVTPTGTDAIISIPYSLISCPDELDKLIKLVLSIRMDALRNFVYDVFSDRAFTNAYACQEAHPEGHRSLDWSLLEHGIKCAEMVAQCQFLAATDRDAGIVAALLHNAGKTLHRNDGHNHQLDIVKALHWPLLGLEHDCLHTAEKLRQTWSSGSHSLQWNPNERMPASIAVQLADQICTELGPHSRSYSIAELWHRYISPESKSVHFPKLAVPSSQAALLSNQMRYWS